MGERRKRGFAAMSPEQQREIARRGGQAAHKKGTAHKFTSDEARIAGHKGGRALSSNRQYMSQIGRKGGQHSSRRETRLPKLQEGSEPPHSQHNVELKAEKQPALKATDVIREDHRKVEELFLRYEEVDEQPLQKEILIRQICQNLRSHTQLEEEFFYPALQEALAGDSKLLIAEALAHHGEVKSLIERLSDMTLGEPAWESAFQQLKQCTQRHIEAEEKEILPEAEQRLKDQLESLGARMRQYHSELEGRENSSGKEKQ